MNDQEIIELSMQSESVDQLALALATAKKAMKVAKQSGRNPFFKSAEKKDGSHYSTMQDVDEAISQALSDAGLAPVTVQPIQVHGEWMAYGVLRHKSGQWIAGYVPLLMQKRDMQALKSALTYAQRMLTLMLTGGVSGEDDDGNATVSPPSEPVKKSHPQAALTAMQVAVADRNETEAMKLLNLAKLRESEKVLPRGTASKMQQMFDNAFQKEAVSG
jgi:hypothetical protein